MKITIENYEAFLLDYIEGNLNAEQQQQLQNFLLAHPELDIDPAEMDFTPLSPEFAGAESWENLHQSAEPPFDKEPAHDYLFFKVAEGTASADDVKNVERIVAADENSASKLEQWKKSRLAAETETAANKQPLYRIDLELPVSEFNYDNFLMAYADGLLSAEQVAGLEQFCEADPRRREEFKTAAHLKLQPAAGIFYPYKSQLYRKKAGAGWMKIAAAVIVLIAGGALFTLLDQPETNNRLGQNTTSETRKSVDAQPEKPKQTEQEGVERETEENAPAEQEVQPVSPNSSAKEQPVVKPQKPEAGEELYAYSTAEPAYSRENLQPVNSLPATKIRTQAPLPELAGTVQLNPEQELYLAASEPAHVQTFGELIQKEIRRKLQLPDQSEEHSLATAVMSGLKNKAETALDAEVALESGEEQNSSFLIRIGSFSVSHSPGK